MFKLLIAGDFCPQERVQRLIEKEDYSAVFGEVIEYTSKVDYSIVNLEAPVVVESSVKPIVKCGPNLKCTSKAIGALKYAGFNMVTLANNHFYDYGEDGVKDTLAACEKEGIKTVGGGMNLHEASRIAYIDIKGVNVAIINCCEHEFSIATETTGGSNPLNPIQQYYAIKEAKRRADKVIVIVHGGHEMYQLPSPRMKETYRFFVAAGADAVINHHQHCYSGYEIYKSKPIFYGLGNFCFDWKNRYHSIWNEGYIVILSINNDNVSVETIPYTQGNEKSGVSFLKDTSRFKSEIANLNTIIADNILLKSRHENWMKNNSKGYIYALEPYRGKFLSVLYFRNLLPSFLSKKKCNKIINYIDCEAHLDRLRYIVKDIIND